MQDSRLPPFHAALLHPRYALNWLGLCLLWLLVTLLPWRAQMALGRGLGRLSMKVLKSRVKVARRNLELALPELTLAEREHLLRGNFESVGCALFETGMAWFWPDWRMRALTRMEGTEQVDAAAAKSQGMLLLSAHFLTLELNARQFGLYRPGVGVYRPNTNPVLEYAQVHGRCRSNKYLVDRLDIKGMLKALRAGDALWYAPDHDYGSHASVFVPFFAVDKAATITGTATLARVKNTVTLPCFTLRERDGYRLVVQPPLAGFPTGDDEADAITGNRVLEAAIRQAPEQYMWLHRRFKTTPEGVPYRY
ncbi:lipid A biosynthesis lauroyl acyltransferase [Zobellella denitrificans]|uniref:Lipid A biosynthesis acyltransferase n=1 Tax=Zobellella denitrificans TaxID=347534 RepID=A0A231N0S9_9GAMM|nr:LpxL/LpxP family Kdo(2)-lipid IV(A) lauroyl/palmitoleoyl acyltransferase [Zobellella denitrificans]ATG72779.1 lipid A biosynthesis lauroyl acyltransferase [Zobellella denitrificans]OXS16091.1 lipid A biosynthesis lauroyl acyltransferase [Zobellella denitrificans]